MVSVVLTEMGKVDESVVLILIVIVSSELSMLLFRAEKLAE